MRVARSAYTDKPYPLDWAIKAVGPGWTGLIIALYSVCVQYDISIAQIKEKFGTLRFYIGGSPNAYPEAVRDIIDAGERKSYYICENCGAPGTSGGHGWIVTLCDECRNARKTRIKGNDSDNK